MGGGVGALLRYLVGIALGSSIFPYGTLFVNILGSLLLGVITGYFMNRKRGEVIHLALRNRALWWIYDDVDFFF